MLDMSYDNNESPDYIIIGKSMFVEKNEVLADVLFGISVHSTFISSCSSCNFAMVLPYLVH